MPDAKKARSSRAAGSATFNHPIAGTATQVPNYLAVFWREGVDSDTRDAVLKQHGLALATLKNEQSATLRVNQTERLSWVRAASGRAIGADTAEQLRANEAVEWVAPAFRGQRGDEGETGLFTVNPTRVYVRRSALDIAGGAAGLAPGLSVNNTRSAKLHGLAALDVTEGSAIELAAKLDKMLGGAEHVRFETIPFISPSCAAVRCAPPIAEYNPNDPLFGTQWGLQRINVPRAWQIARGSADITVAVIDEGVELSHPDLLLHPQSWNATTDTANGGPTGNHGTACAGIAAARMDNAAGVAGVAAGCRVMAIATATWADVDIVEGLYFAADNGARVVSMSFGVYESWGFWDLDLVRDALQYCHDKGLLLVAASGNENGNIARFPGSDSRTLCVGGSNRSDERKRVGDSSSENWWGASHGPDVDVVAPCLEIPTTDRLAGNGYHATAYYDRFNGTSAATPHVAGIGALLFCLRPALTHVEARAIIERTCDKISPALYNYANVPTKPSGTWNDEVGYGRVNVERALLATCALEDRSCKGCENCDGCGDCCVEKGDSACSGPSPVPWLPYDRCQIFYEARVFPLPIRDTRIEIRVTYQHCLKLIGRQQGPLLYTTTLLPQEEVKIFEFDRYRRVRSATERVSVQTSFRQTLSSLSQTRRSTTASAYANVLNEVRTAADTSIAAGGGLAGFFGAPKVSGSFEVETETTVASGASVTTASSQFTQLAITASQAIEAERALVVSRFEEDEHVTTTSRTLKNHNHCHAVTYFVRRVNEVYEASTRIEAVEWRIGQGPWRSLDDVAGLSDDSRKLLQEIGRALPKRGDVTVDARAITLPTDGTLYEAELAHCSSCEPTLEALQKVRLEKERLSARRACLETELLELEVERRRALLRSDNAPVLALTEWNVSSMEPAALPAAHFAHEACE